MNLNRIISILCLLLFFTWEGSVSHAADSWSYPPSKPDGKFGGGSGSYYDPYLINNAQQLADLAYMVNHGEYFKGKYFKLTTDITLNDNVLNDDGTPNTSGTFQSWTPIGEFGVFSDDDFMGTFDGCGHTIRGFYMKDSKVQFSGLFGTVKEARVKNINMEDCLLSSNFGVFARYDVQCAGILCGKAYRSSFNNIKVSRALITKNGEGKHDVYLGGIIGRCYARDENWGQVFLANSSFEGTISNVMVKRAERFNAGGLVGHVQNCGKGGIVDCTAKGNIYADSETIDLEGWVIVGGIVGGSYANENTPIRNCVNYMDVHFQLISTNETDPDVTSYWISAFGNLGGFSLKNCVNFGNVYVGKNDGRKRDMSTLYLYSMIANEMEDCANYGKFIFLGKFGDPNGKTDKIKPPKRVASMSADKFTRCITIQNGNDIPTLNGVKVLPIRNTSNPEKGGTLTDCHFYYHNNNTAGDLFESADIPSGATRHSSLSDFTTSKPFFSGGEWGVIDDATNAYKGYPMPLACGGLSTAYSGNGESESTAYIINTEADLNKLKKAVNDGSSFKDTYFKLGSDIRITGALDECIGKDYDHPFKGHFDGCGHAIIGLRKSLFGYMYGTVKNLALVDCDIWVNGYATALATQVGNKDNNAEVSNCYVSGIIASSTPWNQQGCASTFAFQVADGSSIHDCYFKGRFVLKDQTFNTCYVAGIAVYDSKDVNTSAESPQGIFNCYASFDVKEGSSGNTSYYCYGICNRNNDSSSGNYFVCSNYRLQNYNGGTKLNYESELNGEFDGKSGWLQGVYRPVLASAKNYAATTPEATPKTVYFDAIPEANPKPNYFYNISIEDPYSDVSLWNLPNMAVYVSSEKKDYIINGYLDQSADFQYKRSANATATAGQLRYDLTQNASGYHMLCLPGVVERGDLPKDSKVMIYGKIRTVSTSQEINEVHVDTIPAGVPCILYVPTSAYAVGSEIPLVMRSEIRSEPLLDANYSNMKGTFKTVTNVSGACITAAKHGDGNVYFEKSASDVSMKPFTAWLAGATGDNVKIVDYVLLDEENEAMTVTLAGLNSTSESPKTTNVKMRRTVKLGQWNTICLPFDLTKAEVENVFGSGTNVEELNSLTYNETSKSYTLVFAAVTETDGILMKAGVPYLIKPGTAKTDEQTSVQLYGFSNKKIICPADKNYMFVPAGKEVTNTAKSTSLTMQGEYNHRMITPYEATDGKSLYVISGNKIYFVNSNVEMKGFRCYFVAKRSTSDTSTHSIFSNAKVMHSDGTSTDLRLIDAEATGDTDAVYDLLGRKRDAQTKGLVIKNGIKVLK